MVKSLKKFGGAIIFYMVVFFGIIAIVSRVNYLGEKSVNINEGVLAINK